MKNDAQGQPSKELEDRSEDHAKAEVENTSVRKKTILIIVIIIATIMVAASVWHWLPIPSFIKTVDTSQDSNIPHSKAPSEPEVIALLMTDDANGKVVLTSITSSFGAQVSDGRLVADFAPYRVGDSPFLSLPVEGEATVIALENESGLEKSSAAARKLLVANSFKSTGNGIDKAGALATQRDATLLSYEIYESDNTVCSLATTNATRTELVAYTVSVGCAEKVSYEKSMAATAPLYTAYSISQATSALNAVKPIQSMLVMSAPDMAEGANDYQRAIVYQQSAPGAKDAAMTYYYKKPSLDGWIYLAASIGLPDCTIFSNTDITEAFKGIGCYETKTNENATVG